MKLNIGFIKSESQFLLKELNLHDKSVDSKILDTIEIKETPLNLLMFAGENFPEGLEKTLVGEQKFYPILSGDSLGLETEVFDSLSFDELADLFGKVNARWIMSQNINTIENLYDIVSHLRELWTADRNAFFEELWFVLKTNLATAELTAVFHDVKEPDPEKGEKPSLFYSYVYGKKSPQIFEGKEREEKLMQEYNSEFTDKFEITEFDSNKGHLVATVKLGLSPILILAKLNSFNQLQRSVLNGIFSGLKDKQE